MIHSIVPEAQRTDEHSGITLMSRLVNGEIVACENEGWFSYGGDSLQ